MTRARFVVNALALALVPAAAAQAPKSAPVTDLRYEVTFTAATAQARSLTVRTTFGVGGAEPVLLSMPIWTPGAYEVSNFARWVSGFAAEQAGRPLRWDKLDYDTWRVVPRGAGEVTVRFDYRADQLDNAMSWAAQDFLLLNGTNVFLYPEGQGFDLPASLRVVTERDWRVATGMTAAGAGFRAASYHELVDMPLFVGRFDLDSARAADRWVRLATYPAGALAGAARASFWDEIRRLLPPQVAVFQETPFDRYTNLLIFTPEYGGASALEHANSHVGIYNPLIIGNPLLASITAHEIFHVWNVKRLRPAEMVPYDYARPQPTPWLWVSEGITDYYADLSLLRGGIFDSAGFLETTAGKVAQVEQTVPVALEDASLSIWIHPTDGTDAIYYPKGSLAGLLLDILIRDRSDNRRSLDDVLRDVYRAAAGAGRGFTHADWWGAVRRAAGAGQGTLDEFEARYVDGREPLPWATVLPLAGLALVTDTLQEPRLGITTDVDSIGLRITGVVPGGALAEAGAREGDYLLAVGEVAVTSPAFGVQFRARYAAQPEGSPLPIRVQRAGRPLTLTAPLRFATRVSYEIEARAGASAKAVRIRSGIFRGTVDR